MNDGDFPIRMVILYTPKIEIERGNNGLEDDFPGISGVYFQVPC